MNFFRTTIPLKSDQNAVWDQLQKLGFSNSILIEGETDIEVISSWEGNEPPQFEPLKHWEPYSMGEVDWESQWREHATGFDGEFLRIDCNQQEICLAPGAGFGDNSHITTQLLMEMLPKSVSEQQVIDLGSGSGILSFAAAAHGAKQVLGIDIDPAALEHANHNLSLNTWADQVSFLHPSEFSVTEPCVVLMNMISSEQEQAWAASPSLHDCAQEILLSGLREEESDDIVALWTSRGYKLVQHQAADGWLALHLCTIGVKNRL